jgi:PAS domain S-box-containing protein
MKANSQKKIEAFTIEQSEQRYQSLFNSMTDMFQVLELIYDKEGKPNDCYFREVNPALEKLTGKTHAQLIDKKARDLFHFEDHWLERYHRILITGRSESFEDYGKEFDQYYKVIAWKVGKNRIASIFTDITAQKKAENSLKQAKENQYKMLFDSMTEMVETIELITDKKGNSIDYYIRDINTSFARYLGKTKEELINKKASSIIGAITTNWLHLFKKVERTGVPDNYEDYIEKFEGYFYITAWKISNNNLGVSFTDISHQHLEKGLRANELAKANKNIAQQNIETEKRSKELSLANTQLALQNIEKDKRANELILVHQEKEKHLKELAIARELRQFIDTSNTPIFGINSAGLINEWNQASEKITGYKKEEVLGDQWMDYTPLNSKKDAQKIARLALKGRQTSNFEFSTQARDGTEVVLLVNSSTRRNASGDVIGVLAVGQDITELVGYRNELEKKVAERTTKLKQALAKQKELNELKSKFVSTASHEFRTPLSAINFAAGSIKKYWHRMDPNMIENKINKIENQVFHMTSLLDDILIIGKAGAKEIKNNPLRVNLGNIMNEIMEEVHLSQKKSHQIILIDDEALKNSNILIDAKLMRNIFTNLISNAIKYSPNSTSINIKLSSEIDRLIISITDFGIGISTSELKTVFNPFSRGNNVDLIQGTGLGLSIAKEAIDIIKGEMIVKSSLGKGTTFTVAIPTNA